MIKRTKRKKVATLLKGVGGTGVHPSLEAFVGQSEKLIQTSYPASTDKFNMSRLIVSRWLGGE